MPNDNQNQSPAPAGPGGPFEGWNTLFVKQGQTPPAGWRNLTYSDKPGAPGKAVPSVDVSGSSPSAGQVPMIDQKGQTVEVALEHVQHLVKAGFERAKSMIHIPSGQTGLVPESRVAEALASKEFKHASK
jgi:hypothetical protein